MATSSASPNVEHDVAWARIAEALGHRVGHFELESRHHAERWFDLERLFQHPRAVEPLVAALARRIAPHAPDIVCGPLVEGAFVALGVARELDVEFMYAERQVDSLNEGLFPVGYRLPGALRDAVAGRRVAIVNDVINAGSAVRASLADLEACGAQIVAMGSLLVLGESATRLANAADIPLEALVIEPNAIFAPVACPMCRQGVPLTPHPGS